MRPRSTSVLIVDDDPMQFSILHRLLSKRSISAISAPDHETALSVLGSTLVHAAVVDFHLAGSSGATLIAEVRRRFADVQTVLVSGTGAEELAQIARRCDAHAWLEKPFGIEDLMVAIDLIG
jgi:ActR/RegA family two-component response regulator